MDSTDAAAEAVPAQAAASGRPAVPMTTEATAASTSAQPELHMMFTNAGEGPAGLSMNTNQTPEGDERLVCCRVKPPAGAHEKRTPSDICCVLDISGSMGCEATIQGASGAAESQGLSLLDVAKHGIKTVIQTLGKEDRLSVVWFNHDAKAMFELLVMDEKGQETANTELDSLNAGGTTNISQGLQVGLEVLREGAKKGRLGHIMLLTDGQTNDRPAVMTQLRAYKEQYERLPCTISTFGFGYAIDSPLIDEVAAFGDGTYSFIPDAGFVGTCFVNTLSNLLVTMAREVYLQVDPEDGAKLLSVMGGIPKDNVGEGFRVRLGTLQYGQNKDIVLRMRLPPNETPDEAFLVAKLQYETEDGETHNGDMVEVTSATWAIEPNVVLPQVLRCEFVDRLQLAFDAANKGNDGLLNAQKHMLDVKEIMASSAVSKDPFVLALIEDVNGQSTEAVSRMDWFSKWGKHYYPSLIFAHRVQQCNNFKDPGVQQYGGSMFKTIQDQADEAFNTLPPPKPKVQARQSYSGGYRGSTAAPAAPVNMAMFNDRGGG